MKKFLSVFCAIAMMATLVVPSYAASEPTASMDDVILEAGNGVQEVQMVLNVNSGDAGAFAVEACMVYDTALTLKGVDSTGAVADAGLDVTPGGSIANNPYKMIADALDAAVFDGTFVTYTFEVDTTEAGEYTVYFYDEKEWGEEGVVFMNDDADFLVPVSAKIIVEEAAVEEPEVVDGEVSADFGANYAYIRENKYEGAIKYELCVISALKNISGFEYAGFEVKVAGKDAVTGKELKTAYKKFTFKDSDVDVAQLGEGFEYMVYDSFVLDAADADTAVYFRAYGKTADGIVYGAWKSIDSLAK